MFDAFAKLLNMSLSASILVFAIILFRLLFKKSSKRIICFLWILVAIRLMCPVSIESHISVFNLLRSKQIGTEQAFQFQYSGHSEKPTIEFTVPTLVNDDMSADSMTIGVNKPDFYGPTVVMIWMAGVVIMLAAALISYMNLQKEAAASIQRENHVFVCDEIQSPFILGLFKPTIYLPSGMDESVVKSVLLHEKAHIKRRDHIWKPLGYLLLSVYWFNPVMWIAFILLCRDIEAACDEKVITGMGKEDIAGYTEALLFCAVMRRKITACPVAFGETNVKGRVKNVLNYKKPSFWILSLSLVASLSLAAGFLTDPVSGQVDAAETEKKELYTDFIGDAPTVAAIAQNLPYPAGYIYSSIELQTEKEPYELHIYLSGEGKFEPDDFLKCADYAFEHIGNLSIILFLSEDSGEVLAVHAEPEELLWEEETPDWADSTWDVNASDESVSIIGGADGPTSIFLAGKLGDGSEELDADDPTADDLVITQTRHFYNYKTDSAEDAVNIANICFEEVLNGHFPMSDFSQSIESLNGGERLIMTFDEPLDASEDWEDHFSKVGNMLLALVDQLQEIRFEYQIEGEDELITLKWNVNAANESLMEGDIKEYGSTKEKIDQLMEEMGYDPYQAEIIGMDRFGIRLSTKNVSPTGLTLVCVQDGTETTGQLQTGEKYKLVVQNGDTWEDVDYATDAIGWEEIALLIPNNGETHWDIDWTRIYGELPEGKYCIVKEINDFRAVGDYDTQIYSVAFEIPEADQVNGIASMDGLDKKSGYVVSATAFNENQLQIFMMNSKKDSLILVTAVLTPEQYELYTTQEDILLQAGMINRNPLEFFQTFESVELKDFSYLVPDEELLEKYVGKTIGDLIKEGFRNMGWEYGGHRYMAFYANDKYEYAIDFEGNEDIDDPEAVSEDDIKEKVITQVKFESLSGELLRHQVFASAELF